MQHFLDINQLTPAMVELLLSRAHFFKEQTNYPQYAQHSLATLFYENSTRTRLSFEIAAKKLGMPVFNLDIAHSSETKGECLEDTLANLAAMGIRFFVIRHSEDYLLAKVANAITMKTKKIGQPLHLINAGDGQHAHPSQALLDLMTIGEQKPALNQLKVTIVGDVCHSRVANSLQHLFALVSVKELMFVTPPMWQPKTLGYGRWTDSLHEGLKDADVVIGLRVQQERLEKEKTLDLLSYHRDYGISLKALQWAKSDVMIMHPGPINRGIEMDDAVVNDPRSVILQQVSNGVYMRMAIIESIVLAGISAT